MTAIDPTTIVTLTVGGVPYDGWTGVRVSAGIERLARDFQLDASFPAPWAPIQTIARPGDLCTVMIGADLVLTGYIDAVALRGSASGRGISLTGRSRTADAIDCSADWPTGQFRLTPLEGIATALCAPHGILVSVETVTGGPFPRVHIEPGETVQACIERLAVQRGVLVTDDALGRLVLTRAGVVPAATALIAGVNIVESAATLDVSQVFQTYEVRGQRAGSDLDYGVALTATTGLAMDTGMSRPRKLILQAEGGTDIARAKVRANWEAANRAGKSVEGTFVVRGWRQFPGGPLWAPNQLVAISDPVTTFDGVFLIVEVSYVLDNSGFTTELRVAPPAAYQPLPPAERPPAVKGSRGREGVVAYPEVAL